MQAVILVIDSFGIGEAPDAGKYGDRGANTALHICQTIKGNKWPNLKALGLGNAGSLLGNDLPGCEAVEFPEASFGVMAEKSPGKDTTTGHWEIAGIELDKPFYTFPSEYPSFPSELTDELIKKTGRNILGNKAASGTVIIEEFGKEHLKTGDLICYTSSDSVFQIAAHEDIVSVAELYEICRIARKLCDLYNVGRVIARPFTGKPGNFIRTTSRKDFSIALPNKSLIDILQEGGVRTAGVGKIGDIFNEQGLDESYHDKGNRDCIERTLLLLKQKSARPGFIFINLVDTDMMYGHRRDIKGYFDAVSEIDARLPEMTELLDKGDLLIITADHGCDPAFKGTDHTREYVPLLVIYKGMPVKNLGIRYSFSDIAKTIADYYQIPNFPTGVSFKIL